MPNATECKLPCLWFPDGEYCHEVDAGLCKNCQKLYDGKGNCPCSKCNPK